MLPTIVDRTAPVKFSFNGVKFLNIIKGVDSILGKDAKYFLNIVHTKEKSYGWLLGLNDIVYLAIKIPDLKANTSSILNFPLDIFKKALVKKKDVLFSFNGSFIQFKELDKKGAFKGKTYLQDLDHDSVSALNHVFSEKGKKYELDNILLHEMFKGIDYCFLQGSYEEKEPPPIFINIKGNRLKVYSHDEYHISYYDTTLEDDYPNWRVNLSSKYFKDIKKLMTKDSDEINFSCTKGRMLAYNEDFSMIMPLFQIADKNFDIAPEYIFSLRKHVPVGYALVNSKDLIESHKSIMSIFDKKSNLLVKVIDDTFSLAMESSFGKIIETIGTVKVEGKTASLISPQIFGDIISHYKEEDDIALKVYRDKCIHLYKELDSYTKVIYICSIINE